MTTNAFSIIKSVRGQQFLLLLLIACIFPACNRSNAEWRNTYKTAVVGDWEEARGTREVMHFTADGKLVMDSPSEHHSCSYEFPDRKHILLDCLPPETPHKPNTYGFALVDDKMMISDSGETGTYKRAQAPQP